MKSSKHMEVVSTSTPLVGAIVDKENGKLMVQFRVSPYASFMQNAELASDIMEAYEKYSRLVYKGGREA